MTGGEHHDGRRGRCNVSIDSIREQGQFLPARLGLESMARVDNLPPRRLRLTPHDPSDRPGFLRGSIDALEDIRQVFAEQVLAVQRDPRYAVIREHLNPHEASGNLRQDYTARLDLAVVIVEAAIDVALRDARRKLVVARDGEVDS